MLTWYIERHGPEGSTAQLRWGRGLRRVAIACISRDEAEQMDYLRHGDWLMDGRWLAFHHERSANPADHFWRRWGIALGGQFWLLAFDWPNPNYDTPEAQAMRDAQDAAAERSRVEWRSNRLEATSRDEAAHAFERPATSER